MEEKKALSATEGRKAAGGLGGYAAQILSEEIQKAQRQPEHSLNAYVTAVKDGDAVLAAEKLIEVLVKAVHDKKSPLSLPALLYAKLPIINLKVSYAAENFDNDKLFDKLPREIKRYAGLLLGYRSAKGEGGSGKGKGWRKQVQDKYVEHQHLKLPATRLAAKIHKQLLKEKNLESADNLDAQKDPKVPVPSEHSIQKYLRQLKKVTDSRTPPPA
ncbi:MAG: hypothetical protein V4735_00910 [Pseudomonadota bacterium]